MSLRIRSAKDLEHLPPALKAALSKELGVNEPQPLPRSSGSFFGWVWIILLLIFAFTFGYCYGEVHQQRVPITCTIKNNQVSCTNDAPVTIINKDQR